MTANLSAPRDLSPGERALIGHLLSFEFPGCVELRKQFDVAIAFDFEDDPDACLSFQVDASKAPPAHTKHRIPVEAEWEEEDGSHVHALLHVVNGYLDELEVYEETGSHPVTQLPSPSQVKVFPPVR